MKRLKEILNLKEAVDDHVNNLLSAGTDDEKFNTAHNNLINDKSIGKEHADTIAHQYTGGRKTWPSRNDAIKAIKTKFHERAYQESKMKIVRNYNIS